MIELLKKYARQKSTWLGLITLIGTLVGIEFAPDLKEEISTGAALLIGGILTVYNENNNK